MEDENEERSPRRSDRLKKLSQKGQEALFEKTRRENEKLTRKIQKQISMMESPNLLLQNMGSKDSVARSSIIDDIKPEDSVSQSGKSNTSRVSSVMSIRIKESQRQAELKAQNAALEEKHQLKINKRQLELELELTRLEIERKEEELKLKTEMAISKAKMHALEQYEGSHAGSVRSGQSLQSNKENKSINSIQNLTEDVRKEPTSKEPCQDVSTQKNKDEDPMTFVLPKIGRNLHDDQKKPEIEKTDDWGRIAEMLMTAGRQDYLPRMEPDIFQGDTLTYPLWRKSFSTIIEERIGSPTQKLYYLSKYTSGEAKEAIQGFLNLEGKEAYEDAIQLLEQRYGSKYIIAESYKKKLNDWPTIKPGDGKALRKYSDFLLQCESAMKYVKYLQVLDDAEENKKMLKKLPRYMVDRWSRIVDEKLTGHKAEHCYPSFHDFCTFIQKEARIACGPVSMVRDEDRPSRGKQIAVRSFVSRTDTPRSNNNKDKGQEESTGKRKPFCNMCRGEHYIEACGDFIKLSLKDRFDIVKTKGLCMGCLRWGHKRVDCRRKHVCEVCKRAHPTLLHDYSFKPDGQVGSHSSVKSQSQDPINEAAAETEPKTLTTHRLEVNRDDSRECFHSMIVPVFLYHRKDSDQRELVYAVLDPQSNCCFMSESTLKKMNIETTNVEVKLSTMSAEEVVKCKRAEELMISDIDNAVDIALPSVYTRQSIPASHDQIPKAESIRKWPHLAAIVDKLPPYREDVEIGLLIGTDCIRALKPRDVIPGENDDPYAVRTDLGWGVIGAVSSVKGDGFGNFCRLVTTERKKIHFAFKTFAKETSPVELTRLLEHEFSERTTYKDEKISVEDRRFLQKVEEGIVQCKDGHFQLPLPLKEDDLHLPNNRFQADKRLQSLKRKFFRDKDYKNDYVTFMENIISCGYAERIEDISPSEVNVWYIPHHGVYHPKKQKIRVVFDCSAEHQGEALNRHLLQGPDLTNNLTGILCRFRQEEVAVTCDIEAMYHQVWVEEQHRDYLRFLWWKNGNIEEDPSEYRMKVHLFGATSSPGCANYALKETAKKYEEEFGSLAANFIRHDFYVDDGLKSVPTVEHAVSLIENSRDLCKKGGFNLHKFTSNSKEVLDAIPAEQRSQSLQKVDLQCEDFQIERTLGIQWCIHSDTFNFRVNLEAKPLTRRGILSTVSSIFDPLGLVSPVLLAGKQILQEICRDGGAWDDPVTENVRSRWERWRDELLQLQKIKITRCYKPKDFGEVVKAELHHFSDASYLGYGQCSYLRLVNKGNKISCSLVMSKARVVPSKPITIPRLELTAAVTSVNVSRFLRDQLHYPDLTETFWSDSKVVLGYIANEARRFHIFVANRVQKIRETTTPEQWNYVESKQNPADLVSRGTTVAELMTNSIWWEGPDFLKNSDISRCKNEEPLVLTPDDPELKKVTVLATQTKSECCADISERLKRFSSWFKVKRAVAVCLRLKKMLIERRVKKSKTKTQNPTSYKPVSVQEMQIAEQEIVKLLQAQAFSQEIQQLKKIAPLGEIADRDDVRRRKTSMKSTSSLFKIDPYLDESGVMRVGGRIKRANLPRDITNPVVLPKNGDMIKLIVRHHHIRCGHGGRGTTLNELRSSGYWIVGARGAVNKLLQDCVICKKLRGPCQQQKMADLPEDRLQEAPPFTYSGVDIFGPFYIKRARSDVKRYGAIFTCLSSRAIHIEVCSDLSTDAFINAYRRFVGRRGPVRLLRSDQGSNFIGARNELGEEVDHNKVQQQLLKDSCDYIHFKMNAPHSSHMGGVWERMIRSARNALSALLVQHGSQLDDDLLQTLMVEAEAIVNSRPLTCINSGDLLEPLSPSQILTLKSKVVLPPPGNFQKADVYCRRRWRRTQYLANQFWSRWRNEFLPTLQQRQKWNKDYPNVQPDDVVLLMEDNTPRAQWPLGRVLTTFPSQDGRVRTVEVASRNSRYKRPIHKLVLLYRPGIPIEEPA